MELIRAILCFVVFGCVILYLVPVMRNKRKFAKQNEQLGKLPPKQLIAAVEESLITTGYPPQNMLKPLNFWQHFTLYFVALLGGYLGLENAIDGAFTAVTGRKVTLGIWVEVVIICIMSILFIICFVGSKSNATKLQNRVKAARTQRGINLTSEASNASEAYIKNNMRVLSLPMRVAFLGFIVIYVIYLILKYVILL